MINNTGSASFASPGNQGLHTSPAGLAALAASARQPAAHNAYLHRYAVADAGRVRTRLYLFAYAGGSAAVFRQWPAYFDDSYELVGIQLPGRGSRMLEAAETDHRVLVRDIADALATERQPASFAFYGHSMGALLAHHVALELLRRGTGQPDCLFVSGCKPPHLARAPRRVAAMNDADFIDELRRLEGTPAALLDNAELMQLLLPTIKADFMLLDDWYQALAPEPCAELALPICGMSGRRDAHCSRDDIDGWGAHTHGPLETLEYSGGHFFLQTQEAKLVGDIRARLDMLRRGA
ncbi:MAG TPA: alpha/beta fold hydrolase [Duganella sp.]|jgi:medium-chain acyl-[acyl-carrier-protein] hydrolase